MRFLGLVRSRWTRPGLTVLTSALAIGGVAVFGMDGGHEAQNVRLLSGAAWLASPKVGQVTLLDGSSAEVAAQVQVAPAGNAIDVVQSGATGYTIDQSAGTVRRVDGATFEPSQPESPVPDSRGGLVAFPGANTTYVLDTRRGVLAETDPKTLIRRGNQISLAAQLEPGSATMDGADRLWMVDNSTGELSVVSGANRARHPGVTKPGRSILAVVNGNPVIVDTTERKAIIVDPASGKVDARLDLDLRGNEEIQVSGSPHGGRLYVVAARGALTICDLAAHNCDQIVPLDENSRLGAAVEAGNRLFVPDFSNGQVWIIDLSTRNVVARPQVLATAGRFHLLARDGVVFYNDPNSEHAGVVRLDGSVVPAVKYDPKDPKKGLNQPSTQDDTPPPPDQPQQPDPNQPPDPQPPDPNQPPTPNPNPPPTNPNQPPPTNPIPPPPNEPPPNEPPPKPVLKITLSKTNPVVDEDVSLKVTDSNNVEPTSAHWDYADGSQGGDGVIVTHRWATAKTYLVSVQAVMPDGQAATTSLSITVSPPAAVTVPNVVGQTEATARATITSANLVPVVAKVFDNTVAAGRVISQSPAGNASVPPQSQVNLTVSSGPRPPVDLIGLASGGAWRSGAGALPFGGSDVDERGFVLHRNGPYDFGAGPCVLEDGTSTPRYLETHPQWVANGFIEGDITLPAPVAAGDRLSGRIGFIDCRDLNEAGNATFTISVITPGGSAVQVFSRSDSTNGTMPAINVDLTPHAGATKIRLRVDAGASDTQDWASWVGLRITGG